MPIDPIKETPCAHGRVYRCDLCSFGAVLPRPSEEALAEFYELGQYYTQGKSHLAEPGETTFADRLRVHLAWRLDAGRTLDPVMAEGLLGGPKGSLCDIGCGNGAMAAILKNHGFDVVGVERDAVAAERAVEQGVELHQGAAEQLPDAVTGRRFDLVCMIHVLEHCLDPVRAVANAAGITRPGGYFVCEVPNNASAGLSAAGPAWENLDIPRHLNFFSPDNLRTITTRAGLEVESLYYHGYCRQFMNEWINTERRIWDAIARSGLEAIPRPVKNSRLGAWLLLARTAFAPPGPKYDSVGVIARKR
jgi:SAM-dependent methyltransferase